MSGDQAQGQGGVVVSATAQIIRCDSRCNATTHRRHLPQPPRVVRARALPVHLLAAPRKRELLALLLGQELGLHWACIGQAGGGDWRLVGFGVGVKGSKGGLHSRM